MDQDKQKKSRRSDIPKPPRGGPSRLTAARRRLVIGGHGRPAASNTCWPQGLAACPAARQRPGLAGRKLAASKRPAWPHACGPRGRKLAARVAARLRPAWPQACGLRGRTLAARLAASLRPAWPHACGQQACWPHGWPLRPFFVAFWPFFDLKNICLKNP